MKEHANENLVKLNKNVFKSVGRQLTAMFSLFVVLGVFWCLKLTGITLAGEAFCGMEEHRHEDACLTAKLICEQDEVSEHIHDDSCMVQRLICELEEMESHIHDENCQQSKLICTEAEEEEGHIHGPECYDSLEACDIEETEGHSHTEECFCIEISCEMTEEEGHVHKEECYEYLDECTLEEHIHVESCYSDINADLEMEEDWEKSLSDVTEGVSTAETLVSVARSQIGYTESTLNFEVDLHGVRHGITRYGQWYGNPYGDWSAMFVSFCLNYAGAEDLPANAGPESMRLEWEEEGLYEPMDDFNPEVGNIVFLRGDKLEESIDYESVEYVEKDTASMVAIITEVTEDTITVIQGDFNDAVSKRTIDMNDSSILGYGLVPENSPYAVMMMSPRAVEQDSSTWLAHTINYSSNMFTDGRSFVIYAEYGNGLYYAFVSNSATGKEQTVDAVPIAIDETGNIYADIANPESLLWNFIKDGNNYKIQNVATGRWLHPGGDDGVIYGQDWPTALQSNGTGAKFVHTSNNNDNGIYFNTNLLRFEDSTKNKATTLYFGVAERCTVWLDGTNGGLSSFGGSPNQSFTMDAMSETTLPMQWQSPTKYNYKLRGWYDVTHGKYYAPGETVIITESTVFYADWMAETYDVGVYNAEVANTVSTKNFITTQLFDYGYLFNALSADSSGSVSSTNHSETWGIVQNGTVDYEGRDSIDFIFLDYGSGGTLDYPNNRRDGVNQYPGAGKVTGGIYNEDIKNALFATDDNIPGKVYLGTADHLFQIMDDESNPYYGYYYYDSALNAASYNQSDGRFYVYDYLEATSAELNATKTDFLPLNSPYANKNNQQTRIYDSNADVIKYVYDAKYNDSQNYISTNYAFGMKIDIKFYLPNQPGQGGNQDLYGNDMRFTFSGDDDLWVLVDGKLALDIGGIHQAEDGEINFSTGEVTVQGKYNEALSEVVSSLEAGKEHTLTVMYLERGASHSNCAIYFNLAPRYGLEIQKEDVLTRDLLNGAKFSVYSAPECTENDAVQLWESEESYLRDGVEAATNTFTVIDGSAKMWGLGAGNTYYIKETSPPANADYEGPKGIIRMILDKSGSATYNVMILDEGEGISGGFTVHGFQVDEEIKHANIVATNAPKWVKEVTTVEVRKFWDDNQDHSGEEVTVYLTVEDPDGTVRRLQEAQLNAENDWHHLWENLPKYYQDKTSVTYGVEEAYVSGYYSKVEKLGAEVKNYTVATNQWTTEESLQDGNTYLLKTNNGYLSTLSAQNNEGFKWEKDETIAKQSILAQWIAVQDGTKYKLVNKAGQIITVSDSGNNRTFSATKGGTTTFNQSPSNKQIRLSCSSGNRTYYITGNINSSNKLGASTSSGSGVLITPMKLSKKTTTKSVQGEVAYQITNTPLQKETSLKVQKEWDISNGGSASLYEKEQVTVKLLANEKDTGRTVTLTLKNGWTDEFQGLPYEDDAGVVINYTVEEVWKKSNWSTEHGEIQVSSNSPATYSTVITNTYQPGGPMLPSTGTAARMIYVIGGASMMLFTLIYGVVSRRKRERRFK